MRLLAELDERQVRLGYVNCVVLAAGRHLDTRTALRRRFDDFVFARVYDGTAQAAEFLAEIDEEGRLALEKQDRQRLRDRGGSKAKVNPAAILRREQPRGRFRYRSHLWILQRCMPSHLGPLAPDRSEVFLEHAKHLGLLAETYALTETGHVLRQLLLQRAPKLLDGRPTPNPLYVGRRLAMRALYAWALLENDILTPFLLSEFLARRQNDPELLAAATQKLLDAFGRGARVDSAVELKRLRVYRDRVAKSIPTRVGSDRRARRTKTSGISAFINRASAAQPGFKIHRHHVRPRLEHYVDVGLLARRRDASAADTVYEPSPETARAVAAWAPLLEDPKTIRRFLDTEFFRSSAEVLGVTSARPCTRWESLMYFAKAFELTGREIGFTPGRTVSFAACLLALEDGRLAEINCMFDAVREGARTNLGEHLIFSGGSRFDREFLIRVKPEAMPIIQQRLNEGAAAPEDGQRE
jgi:hypothetical protein